MFWLIFMELFFQHKPALRHQYKQHFRYFVFEFIAWTWGLINAIAGMQSFNVLSICVCFLLLQFNCWSLVLLWPRSFQSDGTRFQLLCNVHVFPSRDVKASPGLVTTRQTYFWEDLEEDLIFAIKRPWTLHVLLQRAGRKNALRLDSFVQMITWPQPKLLRK